MRTDSRKGKIAPEERLIVALDTSNAEDAMSLVRKLTPRVTYFKVGLQLFLAGGGFDVVGQIGQVGGKVFLDLKMLDIPETIRRSLHVIATQHKEIAFATIHVLNKGFEQFLSGTEFSGGLKILVVTVLTSMDDADLAGVGGSASVEEAVSALTRRALELGCHGVIASGLEARALREQNREREFLIVTPGIRPTWASVPNDDQKRVVTPRDAILNGADYLVVGRPILQSDDPFQAACAIQEEIASARQELESASSNDSETDARLKAAV